jgi:O-antigen/teichoic acid export membrane protein
MPAPPARSGARSGALIAVASLTGIVLNYGFLLVAGRTLGASSYGALAALLGLLTVVLLPAGALQLAVSREISRRVATGDEPGADGFLRATVRLAALGTAPLVAVGLVLSLPLARILGISTGAVALTAIGLCAALLAPVAIGAIQGFQRFTALAAMYVLPFALRLVFLAAVVGVGFRLGGAVLATVAGALASMLIAVLLIREPLRRGAAVVRPPLAPFLRYLGPVALGLIGIAVLTNLDVLVVKARFPGADAGDYAAASAFARVAFFLPATILSVLFPRTAARQARGEDTEDILGRSLLVTAGFCGLLAIFYAAAGRGLVVTTYGAEFFEGGKLTAPYAVAMGLYSLANILVGYHLSRGETRYAWIVALAAPIQLVVLTVVPKTLEGVVWTNVVVATALLIAHELVVDTSVPALREGFRHFARPLAGGRVREIAVEGLLVLAGMMLFVCALFLPLVLHLGSLVVGRGDDAAGEIAALWWMQHEGGYHLFGTVHHTLTGAPLGWSEGNGSHIQSLLPYYPAYLATKAVGPVAAYNLVLLSGYVFSGAAMYLLARYLGCNRLVAAWASLVYIVFPWHLARTPHGSLVHLEFLPLLVLALVAASRKPTWLRFAFVGLVTLACWLTAGYFGAMAFVATAVFALTLPLTAGLRRGAVAGAGLVGSALAATLFVALLSIISGFGRGAGLQRAAGDLSIYGLRPLELVIPAAGNLVVGSHVAGFLGRHDHGSNTTETSNYLGWLTIGLALVWVVLAWRKRDALRARVRSASLGLIAIFIAALAFALPSPVGVVGHLVQTPSRLMWEVVPAIRVPSRWTALVLTALVPLAALGLQAIYERVARGRSLRASPAAAVVVVAAAFVLSFLELTISPLKPHYRTTPPPAEYTALERTPNGVVAEYPLGVSNDHVVWQTLYRRPVMNNADFGTPADDAERAVLDPSAPGVAQTLAFLGVTAIVTHPDALDYIAGASKVPNATWGPGYKLVARTPDGTSVWRVVAPPAPALVTLPGGFGQPSAPKQGVVEFPLDASSGVGELRFTAQQGGVVRLSFDARPPGREQTLRLADETNEVPFDLMGPISVSALVEIPRGTSYLLVKTDPPATSDDDAIVLSGVHAERGSGAPALHAVPISADPRF